MSVESKQHCEFAPNLDRLFELFQADGVPPRANGRALADLGYRLTDRSCAREDCNGRVWYDTHELVCETCSTVLDYEEKRSEESEDPWRHYWSVRSEETYSSGIKRCTGGYGHSYEWTSADETDGAIVDLDPEEFYR